MRLICSLMQLVSFYLNMEVDMFYNKKIEDIEKELNTSIVGLNDEQVLNRVEKYGKNIDNSIISDNISVPVNAIEKAFFEVALFVIIKSPFFC